MIGWQKCSGFLKNSQTAWLLKSVNQRKGQIPVTKNVNSISLTRREEERNDDNDIVTDDDIIKTTGTEMEILLTSHSHIYPLGIAEFVEVAEHVYLIDFVILDIKENKKRPFILGTPFLITAKAMIKFDKGTITLRSRKNKISFNKIPESLCKDEKRIKNDIEPIAHTMTVNRLVLKWEELIKLRQEKEMEFDR
uniref:Reverse transcriptase domain-containing protein n=1 Tax=Tanacetum cinerariifolium TaxID=118510 RepID=A0A6L2MZ94_TANCI|nr:hypothetical protein [Tanacetum cinerariifolium]